MNKPGSSNPPIGGWGPVRVDLESSSSDSQRASAGSDHLGATERANPTILLGLNLSVARSLRVGMMMDAPLHELRLAPPVEPATDVLRAMVRDLALSFADEVQVFAAWVKFWARVAESYDIRTLTMW